MYRDGSAILPGVDFLGTGSLSDRIWAKPSVTVLGMDLPNTAEASNVLLPEVTAKLSMRIVPGSDADAQLDALMAHLRVAATVELRGGGREGQDRARVRRRLLASGDRGGQRRPRAARTAAPSSRSAAARRFRSSPRSRRSRRMPRSSCGARRTPRRPASTPPTSRSTPSEIARMIATQVAFIEKFVAAASSMSDERPTDARRRRRREVDDGAAGLVHRRGRDGRRGDLRAARRGGRRGGFGGVAVVPHRRRHRRAAGVLVREARRDLSRRPAACSPTSRRASARGTSRASCRGCST